MYDRDLLSSTSPSCRDIYGHVLAPSTYSYCANPARSRTVIQSLASNDHSSLCLEKESIQLSSLTAYTEPRYLPRNTPNILESLHRMILSRHSSLHGAQGTEASCRPVLSLSPQSKNRNGRTGKVPCIGGSSRPFSIQLPETLLYCNVSVLLFTA